MSLADQVHADAMIDALRRERAQCCRDICQWCVEGEGDVLGDGHLWYHHEVGTSPTRCAASPIRERIMREYEIEINTREDR